MNTVALERDIRNKKAWLQSVADHTVEQATMDAQSNYAFRMAQEKLTALDRTLRRIHLGTFGRCDECGGAIEAERLELLIDSDHHLCAKCAQALRARRIRLPASPCSHPTRGRLNVALEMA